MQYMLLLAWDLNFCLGRLVRADCQQQFEAPFGFLQEIDAVRLSGSVK